MSAYSITRKTAGPWVDIDLNALAANYAMLKKSAPGAEIAAVVKCDAYGLGINAVANRLSDEGCASYFVAYPEEGAELRKLLVDANRDAKIYVFNGPMPETMSLFKDSTLTPVLNSLEQAEKWRGRAGGAAAALHIDTGMNRLGASLKDANTIAALADLKIELVLSHLACASNPSNAKNDQQRELFAKVASAFPDAKRSLSASGGAMMDQRFHFDLARPGIALYGGSPFDDDDARISPVASLRAPIVQLREISAGETVGYDATFTAGSARRLATVALGYGDGFPRAGSGKAAAEINGERAQIAGRVSMDLISLDITNLKTPVKTGDIATFFGDEVSLFEAAKSCDTISYELLTGLGGRVDRRYV